jgi:adenine-specific DNA-methyltransferase
MRRLRPNEEPTDGDELFHIDNASAMFTTPHLALPFDFRGKAVKPPSNRQWQTTQEGMRRLDIADRLLLIGNSLRYVRYFKDFPVVPHNALWTDTGVSGFADPKVYAVQTSTKVIARCLLMTTDPGDLVFDPTCGSGTTAYVAEQWGRRWVTCDTSRVAIALAKQRLMTALYDYYELAHPEEGVGSGFVYKTVPHVTLQSIANNPEIREGMTRAQIDAAIAKYADQETLYDQPHPDKSRARVAGPFTVEAVPAPVVKPLDATGAPAARHAADASEARSGETLRHAEWREELLKTGIRGKSGQRILFSRVEPLPGTRWLHAEAETKPNPHGADRVADRVSEPGAAWGAQRVVISFGPEHAPLEQKQVECAWQEASSLAPKPALLVFAAFQFDPEAAKDIDELTPTKAGMTLLKAQMNPDLLTADLKKKRASNESFWLVGQPDVELRRIEKGEHVGLWQVEVRGFDYYNTKTGEIDSGSAERIAIWLLDPDYDDRSLFPRQVFFPMAGEGEGWARLARSLRAALDEERIEAYRGTVSLPFEAKRGQKVAVKVVDDRGIESLRIVEVE